MRHKLIIIVSAALLAATMQAGTAGAADRPPVHPATGHWAGFAGSAVDPSDPSAPFSVQIASQTGPLVRGEVVGIGNPDIKSTLTGIVTPAGRASLLARGGDGGFIIDWTPATLAEIPGMQPCIFEGRYRGFGRRTAGRGPLLVVHQIPDPEAPSVAGSWRGTAQGIGTPDIRPVEAQFTQTADGLLAGRLTLGTVEGAATFDLAGRAAALEDGGVGIEMVGGGDDGMIIINGFGERSPVSELRLSYQVVGGPDSGEEGGFIIVGG